MRYLDVCAGIGGFRLGLDQLGFECVGTVEVNSRSITTYNENFGTNHPPTDIFELKEENVNDHDILCAGFPCQAFSIAGKGAGFLDPRGTIIFEVLRIINAKKPKFVFLENVKNLVSHQKGETLKSIFDLLNNAGYVPCYKVINSKNFGVPQSRERVFIVAIRKDIYRLDFYFPAGKPNKICFNDIVNHNDNSIPISKKWNEYIDLYTGTKSEEELSFDVPKTRKKIERIAEGVVLNDCILTMRSSGIRAYPTTGILPTLAVSISGGGAMIPVYTKERRHLSLLELKRIMGFPDSYKFPVSRTDAIKQLANSVCPPVIYAIGKEILNYSDL
jgi:DNA (cytosine-5)-methyltransferase 1